MCKSKKMTYAVFWCFLTSVMRPEYSTGRTETVPSLVDLAKRAVEIESFSGNEAAIVDFLAEVAEEADAGLQVIRGPFGLVVIAEGADGKDAPLYLFDGHIDTVNVRDGEEEQWTESGPFEPSIRPDADGVECLYGKGSVDQQGGYLAAFKAVLEMARSIPAEQRRASVGIALMRFEELAEGVAPKMACAHLEELGYGRPEGVIITEPSNSEVMIGQMGRMMLRIKGDDCSPEDLCRVIEELAKYERTSSITGRNQALVLVGGDLMDEYGETTYSQVADRAVARLDVTGIRDIDGVLRGIESALEALVGGQELNGFNLDVQNNIVTIEFVGQTAHSAFPEEGINAGEVMARFVRRILGDYSEAILLGGRVGEGEVSAQAMGEGVLYYDYRSDVGEDPETVFIPEIRRRLDGLELLGLLNISLHSQTVEWDSEDREVEQHFPAWVSPDSGLLQVVKDAVLDESEPGFEVPTGSWVFCTNGSNGYDGVPKIGIGPGNPAHSHNPDERCPLDQMDRVSRIDAGIVWRLMTEGGSI